MSSSKDEITLAQAEAPDRTVARRDGERGRSWSRHAVCRLVPCSTSQKARASRLASDHLRSIPSTRSSGGKRPKHAAAGRSRAAMSQRPSETRMNTRRRLTHASGRHVCRDPMGAQVEFLPRALPRPAHSVRRAVHSPAVSVLFQGADQEPLATLPPSFIEYATPFGNCKAGGVRLIWPLA